MLSEFLVVVFSDYCWEPQRDSVLGKQLVALNEEALLRVFLRRNVHVALHQLRVRHCFERVHLHVVPLPFERQLGKFLGASRSLKFPLLIDLLERTLMRIPDQDTVVFESACLRVVLLSDCRLNVGGHAFQTA